jgi:hypothetical protein
MGGWVAMTTEKILKVGGDRKTDRLKKEFKGRKENDTVYKSCRSNCLLAREYIYLLISNPHPSSHCPVIDPTGIHIPKYKLNLTTSDRGLFFRESSKQGCR